MRRILAGQNSRVRHVSTAVLHDLPMPARLAPWPRASRTTLVRCLWLAGLLHLWALLWLGSAPEGTAPPGQGVQGRLNVTLRGPSDEGLPMPPPALSPQAGTAPAEAPPRQGGRVRDTELPADRTPGAERLGPPPATAPLQAVPAQPPRPAIPAADPGAQPAPDTAPDTAPEPVLRALGGEPRPSRVAAQAPLAAPAPPPEALPAAALPALAPLPSTALAPSEGRIDAAALRAVLPSAAAPLVPPASETVPLPRLPSTALPALGEPVAAPAPRPATPVAARPAADATGSAPPAAPAPAATDTGPRLGADVAVPATAASAPRPLNLELGRLRGGELSRLGAPGVLPVLPRPPETDKLAAEIEKAAREDCRKAYAGAGLLAVVPLVADSLRGKGCKW